jgi:N-acetylglucosamine-6-phosphate deacetylase
MTLPTNTSPRAITAKALITANGLIDRPLVRLNEGRVESITTQSAGESVRDTLDLPASILCAGFLDVHIHGAGGRDVMEGSAEAIDTVARMLASHGTTRFLATTVTATVDHILSALDTIATAIESGPSSPGAAAPIGIHLEGPFLSHAKRGVHSPQLLQPPSIELFDRFDEAARGHIRLMTIAPELPGALDLIRHASSKGVRVSLGHSDAVASEARAGVAAGGVSATHTFNAMRGLTQREPGMLGVVLDARELYAELICDGIHTTPEAVRLWLQMKGPERALLVTDGMAATGMPDGEYLLGDMRAVVTNGVAMHDGALAGSVLTMERAVANVQAFTGIDLASAVQLASRNPAAMLGLSAGEEFADFNIFDDAGRRTGTILRGRMMPA